MMKDKRKTFLLFYAIIVLIILIYIIFLAPDSLFINKNKDSEKTNQVIFKDIEELKDNLKNNQYDYNYTIDYNGKQYECSGTKDKEKEQGICTKPSKIEYNQSNISEKIEINTEYLEVDKIFELIDGTEAKENNYYNLKTYKYNIELNNRNTDITIYTDETNITKICITNGFLTYILNFSNINY